MTADVAAKFISRRMARLAMAWAVIASCGAVGAFIRGRVTPGAPMR